MSDPIKNCSVVKEGIFLYDNQIECDVRIVSSPVRYGTGDYEDPDEICNDIDRETYYVEYGSTTERGLFNVGGGSFESLEAAVDAVESAPGIGSTISWK